MCVFFTSENFFLGFSVNILLYYLQQHKLLYYLQQESIFLLSIFHEIYFLANWSQSFYFDHNFLF